VPACTTAFSFSLPFSIATLAKSPFDKTAFPTFLVNYDFPNQGRTGLEDYFESIGVHVRPFDGARILAINGVDASKYLVDLATETSVFSGFQSAYETVQPRYMRLMSRYSGDTASGDYTQETGRFAQRNFYPGADSVTVTLQTANGVRSVTIPWAATFIRSGNTTASFIAETCLPAEPAALKREVNVGAPIMARRMAVIPPDSQDPVRAEASAARIAAGSNNVQPTCTQPLYYHAAVLTVTSQ
jgi:hypothetical protein